MNWKFVREKFSWAVDGIVWVTNVVSWKPLVALFNHGKYYQLTPEQLDTVRKQLTSNYHVILTRKSYHFSSWLTSISCLLFTGKWGHWAHALMNTENKVNRDDDFRLIEGLMQGVVLSPFMDVFDCDSVVLLVPKGFTPEEWVLVLERSLTELGLPYDSLYDMSTTDKVSCAEMVHNAMVAVPDYHIRFAALEELITKADGILSPQMFYDCPDFEVVYEVRNGKIIKNLIG